MGYIYQWMNSADSDMTFSASPPWLEKERNKRAKGSAKKKEASRQRLVKTSPQAVI